MRSSESQFVAKPLRTFITIKAELRVPFAFRRKTRGPFTFSHQIHALAVVERAVKTVQGFPKAEQAIWKRQSSGQVSKFPKSSRFNVIRCTRYPRFPCDLHVLFCPYAT